VQPPYTRQPTHVGRVTISTMKDQELLATEAVEVNATRAGGV
jgi:hypothetical protein